MFEIFIVPVVVVLLVIVLFHPLIAIALLVVAAVCVLLFVGFIMLWVALEKLLDCKPKRKNIIRLEDGEYELIGSRRRR